MEDALQYDVVIVGAGPAGLSAAIRIKQLQQDVSVCILEKGSEVGAHILSGAVLETRALDELIPNWQDKGAPLTTEVKQDLFLFLTEHKSFKCPTPPTMHNKGNYIIRLGNFCKWLAEQAQAAGVEIYPGFAVEKAIFGQDDRVIGVETVPMGLDKQGHKTSRYQPSVQIRAKTVLVAEGCHGSLTKQLIKKYELTKGCDRQSYGLGVKELWQVDNTLHQPGLVVHSVGWPLVRDTYGGSFLYHLDDHLIAVGFVVGLDYKNPYLNPHDEFQRFKTHPDIRDYFKRGKRIGYGARALNEGGVQSIPKLTFPGGMLIGCAAGFMNVAKLKGIHTAMKSGMLAAVSAVEEVLQEVEPDRYDANVRDSWIYDELYKVRNIRPGFQWGLIPGLLNAGFEAYISRGYSPWTLHQQKPDHEALQETDKATKPDYPKPDGRLTFDKLSSVYFSNTNHEENQPCHLQLKDSAVAVEVNMKVYGGPEQFYCPAGVYEFVEEKGKGPRLQINAQNCVHCKTCDIKDPTQNINWVVPEGTGGPNYLGM